MQSATWSEAWVRSGTEKYGENGERSDWSAATKPMGVAAGGDKTDGRWAAGAMLAATWSETGVRSGTEKYGVVRREKRLECCDKAVSP